MHHVNKHLWNRPTVIDLLPDALSERSCNQVEHHPQIADLGHCALYL
jgi:hypothetical protein